MVTYRYLLDKPSPPGRLQRLANLHLIPLAIDVATEIEIATGSLRREVRRRPRMALMLAACIGWLGAWVLPKKPPRA